MYTENALLFPHNEIPSLRNIRGDKWAELVDRIVKLPETHEETLAFMLTMIRLNGCMACETDSYRAMRGCDACAQQTLRRFKGEDIELVELYEDALGDVRRFSNSHPNLNILFTSIAEQAMLISPHTIR